MTKLPPRHMSRATFALQIVCVLLLGWLILLSFGEAEATGQRTGHRASPDTTKIYSELRQIRDRLDGLAVAAGAVEHSELREIDRGNRVVSTDVANELRELRRSLHGLEQAIGGIESRIPKPDTFRLADIRKRYPTTNWAACKALLDNANARAEEYIRKHHPSETDVKEIRSLRNTAKDRTVQGELKLMSPAEVLERLGSPTDVELDESGFRWYYESPERRDGRSMEGIVIGFAQGCVWMAEVRGEW